MDGPEGASWIAAQFAAHTRAEPRRALGGLWAHGETTHNFELPLSDEERAGLERVAGELGGSAVDVVRFAVLWIHELYVERVAHMVCACPGVRFRRPAARLVVSEPRDSSDSRIA